MGTYQDYRSLWDTLVGQKHTICLTFKEWLSCFPIEDPEHVDERRTRVGLGSFAEYEARTKAMYSWIHLYWKAANHQW